MYALNYKSQNDEQQSTGGLSVEPVLYQFVEQELLPLIGQSADDFWKNFEAIVADFTPRNLELLKVRDEMQRKIDEWHLNRQGEDWDAEAYAKFLRDAGYLCATGEPFEIQTENVDQEIAEISGPQLVVPVNNARFSINAANARWGSLYDALYGTDVIPSDGIEGQGYDPIRGAAVIRYASDFLDRTIPLHGASHADVVEYSVDIPMRYAECCATLTDGRKVGFVDRRGFVGWSGWSGERALLFRHNGLHIELRTDPQHPVGRAAPGFLCDVVLESAVTTIQDCEDSVAAVDADDKVTVYRNWLGLMTGTLEAAFEKGGKRQTRKLNEDRKYVATDGSQLILAGCSLQLIRNVGHLMTNDAVTDAAGEEIFEGILDAIVTVACAMANRRTTSRLENSRAGSIYIVKPKMHGPDEVRFTADLFARVEEMFSLPTDTIKIGIMDEERRTTVNLPECIRAAKSRTVFINTGFLDRTGDEIHTSMYAGPVLPKETIKEQAWLNAYEDYNVDTGIACGFPGKAQIGKGMWPKPDEMRQMVANKQAHPQSGASCAWVPSPTAATLHAMHYHTINVRDVQRAIATRAGAQLADILTPPICQPEDLDADTVQRELDNNAQGILGYVVRWIDQGVGCSKVPDISDVGLMEDRATLRISSQHIANWLLHGVVSEKQVLETMRRMARIVDEQNASDPGYCPMSGDLNQSIAFRAACDLVLEGTSQANGYTEPVLHRYRKLKKSASK